VLHNTNRGVEEFFEIGTEVAAFDRPREAVEQVELLLSDEAHRRRMGEAARARVERDHSWDGRLVRLLTAAGFPIDAFRSGTGATLQTALAA